MCTAAISQLHAEGDDVRLDPDLVRDLLLAIEQTPPNQVPGAITVPDRTEDEVLEHLDLMRESGLIEARVLKR